MEPKLTAMPLISIMLIDDDEDDLDIFSQALMKIDPSIQFAGFKNGMDAFKLLNDSATKLPDLIFLDLNMPCMNGFECLKKIRENKLLNNTPVIIYSTVTRLADPIDPIYQPVKFLSKPATFNEIIQALKIIISNHILETRDS